MLNAITKDTCRLLRAEINEALSAIAAKHVVSSMAVNA
jgi:hypothetical protein